MDVGLFFPFRNPEPWRRDQARLYADCLEQIRVAEEVGFDSVWLGEHHFTDDGFVAAPLTVAAAIATVTSRVQIGTYCPNTTPSVSQKPQRRLTFCQGDGSSWALVSATVPPSRRRWISTSTDAERSWTKPSRCWFAVSRKTHSLFRAATSTSPKWP